MLPPGWTIAASVLVEKARAADKLLEHYFQLDTDQAEKLAIKLANNHGFGRKGDDRLYGVRRLYNLLKGEDGEDIKRLFDVDDQTGGLS